jgi:small subunit ribosomal protein S11e
LGNKRALLKSNPKTLSVENKRKIRYWKSIGLGFTTPQSAIDGTYVDAKCPFTGEVNIRGRIMRGVVKSCKMKRTIIVRRDYLKWVSKYQRYEKKHRNMAVHVSPAFEVKEGDEVVIGECRPLSKTVRFNVLKVTPRGGKKKFEL